MELSRVKCGYEIKDQVINHLFYMDDLQLHTKNVN